MHRRRLTALGLSFLLAGELTTGSLRADDLADQADVEFSLGADAYRAGEYKAALEHFLMSNRLVANKNVLFNIARSYEQLQAYPAAFRYYALALEGEKAPDARARLETAIARIKQYVLVLRVTTRPSGATLYIDRRDLGARGSSPQVLGLAPQGYKLFAELPGYETAVADIPPGAAGEDLSLDLELTPILGEVSFTGEPGAHIRVAGNERAAEFAVPCTLSLPAGNHVASLSKPGFRDAEVSFNVIAHERRGVRVELQALFGSALISSDEPGALVVVDGKARGFTPAIVSLPVGPHRVRVTLKGFREEERPLAIVADGETRLELVLSESDEVVAASRVVERASEAPSSVTLVGERELSAFAPPTIAEAVRGVPGVYVSDDRSYVTLGMRGIGRLGSYGNRLLVTYDGQPLNDDWIGSSYVGYDALTDLGDVERIEVVRGPGSVLYGTNAFSGVINVVSRSDAPPGVSAGISSNQSGVARARVRGDIKLGNHGSAWASVALGRGRGRSFTFPELGGRDAVASGVDGFESGTLRGHAAWKFISLQWSSHSYEKHLPSAEFNTLLSDPRTRQTDSRSFVELRVEPRVSETLTVLSRVHLNHYRFRGAFARAPSQGGVQVDTYRGSWLGLEQRLEFAPNRALRLTLGGEGQLHYQVEQRSQDDDGILLDDTGSHGRPFQVAALYALADLKLSTRAQLSLGARLDAYSTFGSSLNPRAALIVKPYPAGNTKLIAGKAFRAPSTLELYYNDDGVTQVQSPGLRPEALYSLELEHTHRFSPTVLATLGGYGNYAARLISSLGGRTAEDPLHYENERSPLIVAGAEFGLRKEFRRGAMFSINYGFSASRFLSSNSESSLFSVAKAQDKRQVANSPRHLASVKGVIPIVNRALTLGSRLTLEGPRYDRFENRREEPQRKTDAALLWDVMLSGEEPFYGVRYTFGVYNAFDWHYSVPVSGEFTQRSIDQDGRSFLGSLDVKF